MFNHRSIARVRTTLAHLRATIGIGAIPKAQREWGGANVVISRVTHGGRDRELLTFYALEMSWIFEQMRAAFADLIDGCTKFELYGRLELAANTALQAQPDIGARALGDAILVEAETILDDMEAGNFASLPVALGTLISHDLLERRT